MNLFKLLKFKKPNVGNDFNPKNFRKGKPIAHQPQREEETMNRKTETMNAKPIDRIVNLFKKAKTTPLIAGAKRAATCYAQKQAKLTGQSESRIKGAIRAALTRHGVKNDY